jgi:hypothetical protein
MTICLTFISPASASGNELWRITFDTNWLGPMETFVEIDRREDKVRGVSHSGAVAAIAGLPGDHGVDQGLMVFAAEASDDDSFEGTFIAPWREGSLRLTFDGDQLKGSVEGGAFAGSVSGTRVTEAGPIRDYVAVLDDFHDVVATKIFAPRYLQADGYRLFRERFDEIAALATDDLDLLLGFHIAWQNDPFSHFQLKRSHRSAEEMFSFFDSYRVGFEAATVEFDGDTAILRVRTMMGADTIEQIEAAYDRIAARGASNLVIDLRGNEGGAFAVKPLVEHVIDEPLEAGYFLSQVWNRDHDTEPTREEALAAPQWSGWSIVSFWKAVQQRDILRVRFSPTEPNFDGNVFVLVDERTASAAEFAADALRSSGVATLVGERTAGEMLSQSMFDVVDGFVVSLPVADYYSLQNGRIEGQGVAVDVEAGSENALDVALKLVGQELSSVIAK